MTYGVMKFALGNSTWMPPQHKGSAHLVERNHHTLERILEVDRTVVVRQGPCATRCVSSAALARYGGAARIAEAEPASRERAAAHRRTWSSGDRGRKRRTVPQAHCAEPHTCTRVRRPGVGWGCSCSGKPRWIGTEQPRAAGSGAPVGLHHRLAFRRHLEHKALLALVAVFLRHRSRAARAAGRHGPRVCG